MGEAYIIFQACLNFIYAVCGWKMTEEDENYDPFTDFDMCLEENRLATFKDWPFDSEDGAKCTSEKMAKAGWYHPGSNNEPDLARCFVCLKELDGWEPEDDPMKEHKSHSSKCAFLKIKNPNNLTVKQFLNLEKTRQVNKVKLQAKQDEDEFKSKSAEVRAEMQNGIVEK